MGNISNSKGHWIWRQSLFRTLSLPKTVKKTVLQISLLTRKSINANVQVATTMIPICNSVSVSVDKIKYIKMDNVTVSPRIKETIKRIAFYKKQNARIINIILHHKNYAYVIMVIREINLGSVNQFVEKIKSYKVVHAFVLPTIIEYSENVFQ